MAQKISFLAKSVNVYLLFMIAVIACNTSRQIPKSELDSIFSDENVSDFYFYRKFENKNKTDKLEVAAVVRIPGEHATSLRPTDKYDDSFRRPVFINSKYHILKDSTLTSRIGVAYNEVLVDFRSKIGDTLASDVSEGWVINDINSYFGLPLYEMVKSKKSYDHKIQYVHNLGFVLDEYVFEDSTISWRLEAINGIPLDTFAINYKEYQYLWY